MVGAHGRDRGERHRRERRPERIPSAGEVVAEHGLDQRRAGEHAGERHRCAGRHRAERQPRAAVEHGRPVAGCDPSCGHRQLDQEDLHDGRDQRHRRADRHGGAAGLDAAHTERGGHRDRAALLQLRQRARQAEPPGERARGHPDGGRPAQVPGGDRHREDGGHGGRHDQRRGGVCGAPGPHHERRHHQGQVLRRPAQGERPGLTGGERGLRRRRGRAVECRRDGEQRRDRRRRPAASATTNPVSTASSRHARPRSARARAVATRRSGGTAPTASETAAGPPRARALDATVATPSISASVP